MAKVAVVTGANKGIGLAIVRGLCKSFKGDVYLTSRDEKRGLEAIASLEKENLHPKFYLVDVTNKDSIVKLKEMLLSEYGGLDILVNNAGVYFQDIPTADKLEMMIDINYFGVIRMCDVLFPILKKGARVVHVSSTTGNYALAQTTKQLTEQLISCPSVEEVTKFMRMFIDDAKDGTWKEKGWSKSAYGVSKAGVIIITSIQQKVFESQSTKPGIIVNACCPGFVDTDMTRPLPKMTTPISPDEGADTPLYLALLPESTESPKGCFCRKREVFAWNNDPLVENIVKFAQEVEKKK